MSRRFGVSADARAVDSSALGSIMAALRGSFTPISPAAAPAPKSFEPAPGPRHFTPADPASNPTEGWNPFDATAPVPPEVVEKIDPVAAARAAGYAEGLAAGRGAEEAARLADSAAIDRLCEALGSRLLDRETLANRLRQTVLHLVERIVGESTVAPDLLTARVTDAVKLLADTSEPAVLRLNPDEAKLLESRLPDRISVIADDGIARGGFRLETRNSMVEDNPASWIAQLVAAVDRTPLPDAG